MRDNAMEYRVEFKKEIKASCWMSEAGITCTQGGLYICNDCHEDSS